jgi:hypothetical protein
MGFVRGEPIRSAPVKVLVPPFAMVCRGCDEWVLRADSAPSLATPVGPLPRPIEAFKAAVCYVRNTSILLKNPLFWRQHLGFVAMSARQIPGLHLMGRRWAPGAE